MSRGAGIGGGPPAEGFRDSGGASVELLRRLQHGAAQYVRVEHVHIHEGRQAVIGDVRARDSEREGAST